MDQTKTARIRSIVEEELGEFPRLSALPSAAIEEIAARITAALAPYLGDESCPEQVDAA